MLGTVDSRVEILMVHSHRCCQGEVAVKMTPNRQLVLQLLQASGKPLSAYEVLDRLREQGTQWQPPTVYRALDYLVEQGLAHYLQSIQKYVVCPQQGCEQFSQLLICVQCGQVQEAPMAPALLTLLKAQMAEQHFTLAPQFLELKGVCLHCQSTAELPQV
ncbi:Fur family transcriptional regulator [Pseudaeromonas pectinilytica]|nr:transcriptional repressor [Aeromonadaceae bacterium]